MKKISSVEVFPLHIPFKKPFLLSRGFVGAPGVPGKHVYLKLMTTDGQVGWGESRPMPTWSYETMESVVTTLRNHIAPLLLDNSASTIGELRRRIDLSITPSVSASQPFAISAVEQALYDLLGRESGLPLHTLLGGRLVDRLELGYMISGHDESMVEEAGKMKKRGYSCFKIKISGDPEADATRLREISSAVGDALVWADANQAYNPLTVRRLLDLIRDIPNIACLEQPVPTHDYPGLSRIASQSRLPVAVDESIFTHYDMLRAGSARAADLVVLKVAKSGLITNRKISAVAEAQGIGLLGSGMTESGVGFAASAHLFSTMPILLPVDINGPQFLSDLLVSGLEIHEPFVRIPDKPGLGVEVNESKLGEMLAPIDA
ncbi:MAG: muconate cycloisomerase [Theionarchaea archaeon]|nr:muconate cycloisomerase [Theionarchaea archaeon]